MKRTLALTSLALLTSSAAMAQSSVTVYGRVNTSVEYQENIGVDGNRTVLQNNASRLGFKGVEDLGGGLKADFLLEHRFNSDTGTATGDFWAGDSWVGLSGGFGWIRAGRLTSAAYYATADYISLHNHDTGTSEDKLYTYLSSNKNTVSYTTPSLGGFTVEGSVSAGEGVDIEKVYQLAVNGTIGPIALGAGYEKQAEFDNQQFAIRALGEFGPVTVGAYYQFSDIEEDPTLGNLGERNAVRGSVMYTIGAIELHGNVGWADEWDNVSDSDALQYTLGVNYNLSKRTKLYAFYTAVENERAASYFSGVNGRDTSSIAVGIRHNF